MEPSHTKRIFLSYASADGSFALRLAKELRSKGVDLWVDKLDIKTGELWDRVVENALRDCGRFMVVLSPAAIASHNVMDEVSYALDERKPIFPVLLSPCTIPLRLKRLHYADFTNDFESGARQLLYAVQSAPGKLEAESPTKPALAPARELPEVQETAPRARAPQSDIPHVKKAHRPFLATFSGRALIFSLAMVVIVALVVIANTGVGMREPERAAQGTGPSSGKPVAGAADKSEKPTGVGSAVQASRQIEVAGTNGTVPPLTLQDYISEIRSTKDPKVATGLKQKARELVAPELNFGEMVGRHREYWFRYEHSNSFQSYSVASNTLRFRHKRREWINRNDGQGEVPLSSFEATVEIYIGKLWKLTGTPSDFGVDCNGPEPGGCLRYLEVTGCTDCDLSDRNWHFRFLPSKDEEAMRRLYQGIRSIMYDIDGRPSK